MILNDELAGFREYLVSEERSEATTAKYLRDVGGFLHYLGTLPECKSQVVEYKQTLAARYATASVNSMVAAINSYLAYRGLGDLRVKLLRLQRQLFCKKERELTRKEYERLVAAAEKGRNKSLSLIMQTICATGIRVSELKFITVEAVRAGRAEVHLKGKIRTVLLPKELRAILRAWCGEEGVKSGPVFVTRNGKPLDRSNIWHSMKALCRDAGVDPSKVFPHNLRHLFALTYYRLEKDIVRLADLLGHSSVETTRIYMATSGGDAARRLSHMGLVLNN